MNKSELVDFVASAADLSKAAADRAVDAFTEAVMQALAKKDSAVIVGFGTFSVKERAARTGRDPRTGKTIEIAAKNVVKFSPGKKLKDAIEK